MWGRHQRGHNATYSLHSSPTFQWTLLWDWEFLPPAQLSHYVIARGFEFLVSWSASLALPVQSTTLLRVLSAQLPISAIPIDRDKCSFNSDDLGCQSSTVWYSGSSGCLLFLIGCYPSFGCARKRSISTHASISAVTYICIVYLKFNINWVSCIFICSTWQLYLHSLQVPR